MMEDLRDEHYKALFAECARECGLTLEAIARSDRPTMLREMIGKLAKEKIEDRLKFVINMSCPAAMLGQNTFNQPDSQFKYVWKIQP